MVTGRGPMTLVGHVVNNIELLERLGEGGMGEVWLGRDRRLGRVVAVKAVREVRRLDEVARSRFFREARILSQLEHPNICRLYHYVEEDGGQYLVLEYVEGTTLLGRIQEGIKDSRKLEIALQVAEALAAAHAMSVVHRDLKPANVMIAKDGTVKVLDFGLARPSVPILSEAEPPPEVTSLSANDPRLLDLTQGDVTQAGEVLGTPRYMSPEQARGEPATAASDVYALGLLLQELFTGQPAYPTELTPPEVHNKTMWGDRLPARTGISAIDTLLERITDFQPAARPPASAVVEELERIREEPRQRTRRRIRIVAVLLLVISSLALATLSVRLQKEVERANQEAQTAEATTDFLVSLFKLASPFRADPGEVTARELLNLGVEEINDRLGEQPSTRARLLDTMGQIYSSLGDYSRSVELLEESKTLRGESIPESDQIRLLHALGTAYTRLHDLDAADAVLLEALQLAEGPAGTELLVSEVLHQLLIVRSSQGRYDEAEELGQRSLEIRERLLGTDHHHTGATLGMIGLAILDSGRHAEAEELLARSARILEANLSPRHPEVTHAKANLATARRELGHLDEAEKLLREVIPEVESRLGPDHPELAPYFNELGVILFFDHRWEEAATQYRRSLEIAEKRLGGNHPMTGMFRGNLAEAIALAGRPEEAEPLFRSSIALLRDRLGERHPILADPLRALALVEISLGRSQEAEILLLEAISIREESQEAIHPDLGRTLLELGRLLQDQGRSEEAREPLSRALDILSPALGDSDALVVEIRERLARKQTSPKKLPG